MRKRLLMFLGVAICGVMVAMIAVRMTSPAPAPVRWENVGAIRVGDTQPQVEALLGAPPGVYTTRPVGSSPFPPSPHPWTVWIGDEQAVCVAFDKQGRVADVHVPTVQRSHTSFRHWLADRVGL